MFRLSGKGKLTAEENFSVKVITDKSEHSRGGQCKIRCTKKADLIDNLLLNLTLKRFLEAFNLPPVNGPKKKERRKTLKQHQQEVKKNNKAYLAGRRTWFEGINEFSHIPDEEFIATHTGLIEEVEQLKDVPFLRMEETLRSDVPASYNSVSQGHVSHVKNQGGCGSCVAFATMSLVETCFKKKVGKFGDYSEQHLLDCAYGAPGVYGCGGASLSGYTNWLTANKPGLASEETYPYRARVETCRTDYEEFYQGARLTTTGSGQPRDEETLKRLVYQHGAVMVAVAVNGNFQRYKGGIFSGCSSSDRLNHAVVVVGYGTQAEWSTAVVPDQFHTFRGC